MCFNGVWGSVCSGGLRGESSKVACNQLGHQKLGMYAYLLLCLCALTNYLHCQQVSPHFQLLMNPMMLLLSMRYIVLGMI